MLLSTVTWLVAVSSFGALVSPIRTAPHPRSCTYDRTSWQSRTPDRNHTPYVGTCATSQLSIVTFRHPSRLTAPGIETTAWLSPCPVGGSTHCACLNAS